MSVYFELEMNFGIATRVLCRGIRENYGLFNDWTPKQIWGYNAGMIEGLDKLGLDFEYVNVKKLNDELLKAEELYRESKI